MDTRKTGSTTRKRSAPPPKEEINKAGGAGGAGEEKRDDDQGRKHARRSGSSGGGGGSSYIDADVSAAEEERVKVHLEVLGGGQEVRCSPDFLLPHTTTTEQHRVE